MFIFFKTLLALAALLGLLVVGGLFWLKRKMRGAVGDYHVIAPYLIAPAARISLRAEAVAALPDGGDDAHAQAMREVRALVLRMEAQGFTHLGAFAADEDGRVMVATQHRDSGVIGQAIYKPGMAPFFEFISVAPAGHVRVVSCEPDARIVQLPSMTVETHAAVSPADALKLFAGTPGRTLDLPTYVLLVERVHAARMDSRLVAEPTLADMQACGESHGGGPLTAAQRVRALEMNRESWADAVRVALLDNGRRKLKTDIAVWDKLARDMVVVHEAMSADEVIATMAHHDYVDRLGEQLKRQGFTPPQIFDEINRRLEAQDRLGVAVKVRFPVRARLFARPEALQAAGLAAEAVAA